MLLLFNAPYATVYAEELKFMPMGSLMPDETGCRFAVGQQHMLPHGVQPSDKQILLAKLRPGQVIDLEAHCIKGEWSQSCETGCPKILSVT